MNELFGLNAGDLGAAGIVVLVVLLILLGRLVPRSVLEDVRKDRDARVADAIAERDTWKEAHRESEAARQIAQGQVGELLVVAQAAERMLRALPQPGREVGDEVDSQMAP
jgi:hypothetical protein